MPRIVRCGLIQAANVLSPEKASLPEIREAMIAKHLLLIEQAAAQGVKILSLQELFYGPYFAAEQDPRWYEFTERVPDGPTIRLMQDVARKHEMAMVVPVYEEEATGIYYNTAAVIDADGRYLGKYRKNHIPHCLPAFWEKFYFKPGNLGYPVFKTRYATLGFSDEARIDDGTMWPTSFALTGLTDADEARIVALVKRAPWLRPAVVVLAAPLVAPPAALGALAAGFGLRTSTAA